MSVKAPPQARQCRLVSGIVAQLALGQRLDLWQTGALVAFGKHHVEADDAHAMLIDQLVHEFGKDLPVPGPAPHLGQTFFVNIEHDYARIERLGHGGHQSPVVESILDFINHSQTHISHCMAQKDQQQDHRQQDGDGACFQDSIPT